MNRMSADVDVAWSWDAALDLDGLFTTESHTSEGLQRTVFAFSRTE